MSIFKFYTPTTIALDLEELEKVKRLAYLIRAPREVQDVIIGFSQKKIVAVSKDDAVKRGLENPIIKWMSENQVTIENDYEFEGWPLLNGFKETQNETQLFRNESLLQFYVALGGLAKEYEDSLLQFGHNNSSKLYAFWLIHGKPEKFSFVLTDMVNLFEVNEKNYHSYTHFEKQIFKRIEKKFQDEGLSLKYERENPTYAKCLNIWIGIKKPQGSKAQGL